MKLSHQTLRLDEFPAKYRHMKKLPIQEFVNAVPSLLIGLDNCHLGRSRGRQWNDDDGPVPIMTKLGYVVYGALRTSTVSDETIRPLLLTTRTPEPDLHKLVSNYFSTEDFTT